MVCREALGFSNVLYEVLCMKRPSGMLYSSSCSQETRFNILFSKEEHIFESTSAWSGKRDSPEVTGLV